MYQFQDSLPKLPVPRLEETCTRYLQIVTPLLSEAELARTKAAVMDFLQGSGSKLQRQLEMIARSTHTSYVSEIVNDRFLEARLPLVGKTNIAQALSPVLESAKSPLNKAAIVIHNLLLFYLKIKRRELEPDRDMFQTNCPPLCMVQYDNLFGTSRIPGIKRDRFVYANTPEHVVVIRRNRFYALEAIKGEELPTLEQIEQQLNSIVENTPLGEPALGALTTLPRTQWAVLRSYIAAIAPENPRSLALLDSALFVVCLDETTPIDIVAALENAFYGDGRNRWFDKPVQLIVTADGQLAINIEHTGFDGYTVMRLTAEINREIQQQEEAPTYNSGVKWDSPTQLEWTLTPEIIEAIVQAEEAVGCMIVQHQTRVLEFDEFGFDFLRQHTLNADAVVQLSIQLAYARLHGKIVCVTESVHFRNFRYGRFEDVRTVTPESVELIRAFTEASTDEARYSALNQAIFAHMRRLFDCKKGHNLDYHLLALKSLASCQGDVPEIFRDKAYTEVFNQPVLWTTSLADEMGIAGLVFVSPPVSLGYGVGYLIGRNRLTFCATSQPDGFLEEYIQLLKQSLSELGELLRGFRPVKR